MDELKIQSKWLRILINRFVNRELKKKGINVMISIGSISIKTVDETFNGELNMSFYIHKNDLQKLLKIADE